MNKRLQNDEFHFVSFIVPKFLTSRFPIRGIALPILVTVFLLGAPSFELFAQQKSVNKTGLDTLHLASHDAKHQNAENKHELFSYPTSVLAKTGPNIIKPIVYQAGGKFSFKRLSPGDGSISFNARTGSISFTLSDPGLYQIIYTLGKNVQTFTLEVSSN